MDLTHGRIVWQIALGVASLVCFVTAINWIRATYAMYKAGEARPLLLPFPMFMWMDILSAERRSLTRNRLPANVEAGVERMGFQTIISGNY